MTNSLKVGVVGVPGGWSSEALADHIEQRTGFRLVADLGEVSASLNDRRVMFKDHNLCELDALIVKKVGVEYSPDMLDRLELLRFIEACGVRVFSRPAAMLRLLDRLSCTVTLSAAGTPMPPTAITESVELAVDTVKHFKEAVFKPLYSTKARGMEMLKATDPELRSKIEAFNTTNKVMYIQKRIDIPGKDLGIMFLGGEYVGTYARVGAQDSWNTTINSGGKYEAHDPSDEIIELARNAQALFEMDLTSVDIVETAGGPAVFEVSAFGGFRGLKESRGIDAAEHYVDYVMKKLNA